jgi:hypothetical protein
MNRIDPTGASPVSAALAAIHTQASGYIQGQVQSRSCGGEDTDSTCVAIAHVMPPQVGIIARQIIEAQRLDPSVPKIALQALPLAIALNKVAKDFLTVEAADAIAEVSSDSTSRDALVAAARVFLLAHNRCGDSIAQAICGISSTIAHSTPDIDTRSALAALTALRAAKVDITTLAAAVVESSWEFRRSEAARVAALAAEFDGDPTSSAARLNSRERHEVNCAPLRAACAASASIAAAAPAPAVPLASAALDPVVTDTSATEGSSADDGDPSA